MLFNVNKCHILEVGTRYQMFDFEIKVLQSKCNASNLKYSQQCKDPADKTNRMLSFIDRNFSFMNKNMILPLYISLVRPNQEYAVQFWSPHHTKEVTKLEVVQRRATKMITSLRNKSVLSREALAPR